RCSRRTSSWSILLRQSGLRGTEKEIHQEEAHAWTLQDGKVVRLEWGRDLDTALEAAGLSE
ncbi:MAG: hypothetical protein WKH68_11670, partial [Candidatus Limnocylindria bacterium]